MKQQNLICDPIINPHGTIYSLAGLRSLYSAVGKKCFNRVDDPGRDCKNQSPSPGERRVEQQISGNRRAAHGGTRRPDRCRGIR